MKLFLIRHGEPNYKFIKDNDNCSLANLAPLTSNGRQQAIKLQGFIDTLKNPVFLSSPYTRAFQTACLAIEKKFYIEDIVIDYDFHEWLPATDFKLNASQISNRNSDFKNHVQNLNYETKQEMLERFQRGLDKYIDKSSNYEYVVFSHERVINTYLESLGIIPQKMKYCEIKVISEN